MEKAGMVRVVRESESSTLVLLFGESGQLSLNNNLASSSKIPPVPLPTTSEWDITVCSVSSTNQIHLWLGENGSKLTKLHDAMIVQHLNYDSLGTCISSPEVGQVYSAMVGADT